MILKWAAWDKEVLNMKKYEYVFKKEWAPVKKDLIKLINLVQDEVRDKFTFRFDFIGSASRNMITREINGNVGYDFDVNLRVNDDVEKYTAKKIKNILKKGFDKYNYLFDYDYSEDSSRVITIKIKDNDNSKIFHSCDFAIVNDFVDVYGYNKQEFIFFNKKQKTYEWHEQPDGFYMLEERQQIIKESGLWNDVRKTYLQKKCYNNDSNKKSRSIFAETINDIFNQYFKG